MRKNPLLIALAILALLFFIAGFIPANKWTAFQQNILVDTQEEFNRKNTP